METTASAGVLNEVRSFWGHAWLKIIIIRAKGMQLWAHREQMMVLICQVCEKK